MNPFAYGLITALLVILLLSVIGYGLVRLMQAVLKQAADTAYEVVLDELEQVLRDVPPKRKDS